MQRTRPPYPPKLRRQALELVHRAGRSIPAVADELGCSPQALRTWVKQSDVAHGRAEGLTSEEREELRRLRRENRQLAPGARHPGKTVAFFAKKPETR